MSEQIEPSAPHSDVLNQPDAVEPVTAAYRHRAETNGRAAGMILGATVVIVGVVVGAGAESHREDGGAQVAGIERRDDNQLAQKQRELDSVAGLLAAQDGVSRDTIERKGLGSVESLPGYGQEVSPADIAKLRASVVKIATAPKITTPGVTASWFDNCTGLKIRVGGHNYVATARHCFEGGVDMTELYPPKGGVVQTDQARDIRTVSNTDYGIKTVMDNAPLSLPVAPVTGISIRYAPDIALLSINESSERSTLYDQLPVVSYDRTEQLPEPGASVVGFSMPSSSGEKLIEGKGIYLGRITDPSDSSKLVDLVAIDPKTPAVDACNYGASGSAAVLAGGYITGPLSARDNITDNETTNPGDDPSQLIPYRYKLEDATKLDLSGYSTICEYAVVDQPQLSDLVAGLHRPAHIYTYPSTTPTEGPKG